MSDEPLSKRSRTIFGLVGLGVIGAAATFVAVGSTPDHSGSTYFNASFGRAGQGLDPGKSDVKIRGITVGTVDGLNLERDGRVAVRIRVDEGIRVPESTVARVEPVSVFGPKDILLDLGKGELTGPFLADGARIGRTQDPKDLSETAWPAYRLTKAINPDEVTTILQAFSSGLSGQGPALRRTIVNGTKVIDATHANRAVIQSLISDINGLSGTLGSRGDTINATIGDFNSVAPVVYEKPDKISQLLDQGSALADTVGGTMARQGGNLGKIIDGAGDTVAVTAQQRRNLPVLMDSLNGFFGLLAQIIRIPGPENTLIAQAKAELPLDICKTIIDVCAVPEADAGGDGGRAATRSTNRPNGTGQGTGVKP
ncbi:MCE family protein [Actinomadura sp. 21ATH]|uniref:MCE family protein n=1 Tax=Actinomadura sp. 21ATH TaxID=1735444 RepID=UPI0035BF1772